MGKIMCSWRARLSRTRGWNVAEKMHVNEQWKNSVSLIYCLCGRAQIIRVMKQYMFSLACILMDFFLLQHCAFWGMQMFQLCMACHGDVMWCVSHCCTMAAHRWPCCLDLNFPKGRLMVERFIVRCVWTCCCVFCWWDPGFCLFICLFFGGAGVEYLILKHLSNLTWTFNRRL